MKRRLRERIGLSLLFSLVIFLIFFITMLIVAVISLFFIRSGFVERYRNYSPFIFVLVLMIASITVGTIVSLAMGRFPLKPIQKVISAINKLANGDFSTRLDITHPLVFKELGESFNRMATELEGIELLRTDFVNNFSHEFKTPIVSIKGFAQMLKYGDLAIEEKNEYLDIVITESSRLASLATNVLNLSKVENQTILTEKCFFDLSEQLRRCILMLESKWEEKKILLSVEIQDICYIGNEELLSQVWLNLLDNAIKFTPENGTLSITLKKTDDRAEFILRDSGCGISSDSLPHIFDKFYQADISHASAGNGLGLTLAKKIVELHGGSIFCKSELGVGTEFTIRLALNYGKN